MSMSSEGIQNAIKEITPKGGGDCREFSLRGLKLALEKSEPNSVICLLTDAAPKETELLPDVLKLVKEKKSKVNSGKTDIDLWGNAGVHIRH